MEEEYIHPFLESATIVLEQVINVRPTAGEPDEQDVHFIDGFIWIHIGITGQMQGEVVFGLHEEVAMKLVSAMMGGFEITQIDEIGQSAISELGNMISGNASTILYNKGVKVDITPPRLALTADSIELARSRAVTVPLLIENIGELDIKVMIA